MATVSAKAPDARGVDPSAPGHVLGGFINLLGLAGALAIAWFLADAVLSPDPSRTIAVLGLAAIAAAIAVNPAVGLLGWLVAAPFAQLFRLPVSRGIPDLGLSRVAILVLVMLFAAQVAARRRRLPLPPLALAADWAAVGWALAMLLSTNASHFGLVAGVQNVFDLVIIPLLAFLVARNLFTDQSRVQGLLVALALVSVLIAIVAAREQFTGAVVLSPISFGVKEYGLHTRKVNSFFGSPAIMTMVLALPAPALLYAAVQSKQLPARVLWIGALIITLFGSLVIYVRGGWLATLAGLSVMVVLSRQVRRRLFPILVVVAVLALVFAGTLIDPQAIIERLRSEGPITYRLGALQVGWQLIKQSPILGIGLDNFTEQAIGAGWSPRSNSGLPAVSSHNTYLYVLSSGGLVALLPYLALLGLLTWEGVKLWRRAGMRTPGSPSRTPVDRDLVAAYFGTIVAYVTVAATFDSLNAQFANVLFYAILGAVLGSQLAPRSARLSEAGEAPA